VAKPSKSRRAIRCQPCGKGAYPTLSIALWAGSTVSIKHDRPQFYAYECPVGAGWHLTRRYQAPYGVHILFEDLAA
jgi:hypothetical protein